MSNRFTILLSAQRVLSWGCSLYQLSSCCSSHGESQPNVGPRFGFAFAVNPKTVIRGGWGLMYSYGLEGGSSVGESETTNYTASIDGGNTPTNYFQTGSPFASGLIAPTGNSLGLETDLGNGGVSVDFPNRKIPMENIVSLGFQRELPGGMVLDARYAGNFTSRLRVDGTSPMWI